MKYITKIFYLFLLILASLSCSLEEEPYGFLSSENFYQTEADAYSAMVHMYDIMGDIEYYSRYFYYITEGPTEEMTFKDQASNDEKDLGELQTNPTNTVLTWWFKAAYIGINRANTVMENIPDINMDEDEKKQILGEAHFLRALHYFNLVRTFGEVPYRKTTVLSESNLNAPAASLETIYELIINDLSEALLLMDDTYRYARANETVANALMAKVYITMASASDTQVPKYDFISDPDEYYQLAAQYAEEVFNQNTFTFWEGELADLWDIDNEVKNEFIFSIAFSIEGASEEGDFSKLAKIVVPFADNQLIYLPPDFETVIPVGWGHIKTNVDYYNNLDTADKRRNELIISEVKDLFGETLSFENGMLEYPFSIKQLDKNQSEDRSGKDFSVIRYSDILLVYAEAVGPTAQGYDAVNRIRLRAGLSELPAGLSISEFRERVYEERSHELAFEGERLFDLRRLNKMEEVLVEEYNMAFNEDPHFYALPQSEVDNNGSIN